MDVHDNVSYLTAPSDSTESFIRTYAEVAEGPTYNNIGPTNELLANFKNSRSNQ